MNLREVLLQELDARIAKTDNLTVRDAIDVTGATVTGYLSGVLGRHNDPFVDAQSVTLTSGGDPEADGE